jgi:predicted Zn-dependent protease
MCVNGPLWVLLYVHAHFVFSSFVSFLFSVGLLEQRLSGRPCRMLETRPLPRISLLTRQRQQQQQQQQQRGRWNQTIRTKRKSRQQRNPPNPQVIQLSSKRRLPNQNHNNKRHLSIRSFRNIDLNPNNKLLIQLLSFMLIRPG